MNRRLLAVRIGAAVAVVALMATAALVVLARGDEPSYRFDDDCAARAIADTNPSCALSTVYITVRSNGDFEWKRDTVYPRGPFDELVFDVEGNVGTTEEYLDAAREATERNAEEREKEMTLDYSVNEDYVIVTISEQVRAEGGHAAALGVTVQDDEVRVAVDGGFVRPASKVVIQTPGPVSDTNGTADGDTAVWDSAALMSVEQLRVEASATAPAERPAWALALLPLAAVGALVALYFFARRPGSVGGSGDDGFEDEADTPDDLDDDPENGDPAREPRGE